MLEKFTVAALASIDGGRIREAVENCLSRCEDDCRDRPALSRARKVVLTIALEPVPTDDGRELDSCDVSFDIKAQLPPKQSRAYNMRADAEGLSFNELSPDEARQRTLDEAVEKDPKDKKTTKMKAVGDAG